MFDSFFSSETSQPSDMDRALDLPVRVAASTFVVRGRTRGRALARRRDPRQSSTAPSAPPYGVEPPIRGLARIHPQGHTGGARSESTSAEKSPGPPWPRRAGPGSPAAVDSHTDAPRRQDPSGKGARAASSSPSSWRRLPWSRSRPPCPECTGRPPSPASARCAQSSAQPRPPHTARQYDSTIQAA